MSALVESSGLKDRHSERVKDSTRSEGSLSLVVVRDVEELNSYVPAWEKLAADAIEPNVFYEPWMLIPAIRSLGAGRDLLFVFIFEANDLGRGALCGFFPLVCRRRYKGLPLTVLSLWKHPHCFLCTPLIRTEYASECVAMFFDWLAAGAHCAALMEFKSIAGEGPVHQLLLKHFYERASSTLVEERYVRAFFRPLANADAYLHAALSGKRRRKLERQEKRLSETGRLEHVTLAPDEDYAVRSERFLCLENSGWKGQEASALAATEADQEFFRAVIASAHRRARLQMLVLLLDDTPIAMRCSFVAGRGAFAFKTAFDERFSRFSPGALVEIENVRYLHTRPEIEWMDSCAAPDSVLINRLWLDRRTIETILVPTGKRPGEMIVSLLPLLRWLKRRLPGGFNPNIHSERGKTK